MKTTDKDSNIKPTNDAVESEKLVNKPAEQQPVLESGVEFSQEAADVAAGEQLDLALPESQIVAMADNAEDKESKRKEKKDQLEQDNAEQVAQSAEEQVIDSEQSDAAGEEAIEADGTSEVQGEVAEALAEQSAAKGFGVYLSQLSTQTLVLGSLGILGATAYYRDQDSTELPIIDSSDVSDITENSGAGQVIYTAVLIEEQNALEGVTFSLEAGSDNALSINTDTGEVTLTTDPDYEVQSEYNFAVIATDASGNASIPESATLKINNLDDTAPTITPGATNLALDENSGAGQIIYMVTADDSADVANAPISFSLAEGSDTALTIDSVTGAVTLTTDPDHETQAQYSFAVIATDAAGNASEAQPVTLDINDLDDAAPTVTSGATAVAIDENSGAGQVIYTATSTDLGDDVADTPIAYSLAEGSDAALSIDASTGAVTLATDPDHETQAQYSFAVIATDAAGNASEAQSVTLDINDLDDAAPTVTSGATAVAIDENSGAGQVIYTATSTDLGDDVADTPIAYSLAEGSDAALSINAETGAVTLTTNPDHETQSQYSFSVIATDAAGNASAEQAVTLDINDLDDTAPTITSAVTAEAIDENSGAGQVIYTVTADDSADVADTPIAYSLAEGSDAALSIDAVTGAVTLTTDPDHETQSQYSFSVIATDAAGNASEAQSVTLDINDLDDAAPTVTSGATAVAIDENSGAGQVIYTATSTDLGDDIADTPIAYSLAEGSDAALSIDASTGAVTLTTDPDHETQSQYSFSVIATDAAGNASEAQSVTLDINDLDDAAPTVTSGATAVAIDENSGAGQVIYTATSTDLGDDIADTPIAYSLAEGSDAALSIDASTGAVTLATDPDHETQSQYSFSVIATDAAGNASEAQPVTLDINDLDDAAPTVTSGATAVAIDENSGAGQVIYIVTADDSSDISAGVTFSLTEGSDTALTINSSTGEVTLSDDPLHYNQSSYSFSVIATDANDNVSQPQAVLLSIVETLPQVAEVALTEDAGISDDGISNNSEITVTGIKLGAQWEYSVDNGANWALGSEDSDVETATLNLPEDGDYQILVRQSNTAGTVEMDAAVPVTIETVAPELETINSSVENSTITLTFNELLNDLIPSAANFQITQDGEVVDISGVAIDGVSVVLTVVDLTANALQVSYTPFANSIQDVAGNTVPAFTQMVVSDGYIRDAEVYADTNNDGIADESELIEGVTSDALGQLVISGEYGDAQIIIKGGVNTDTGAINQLELTAPAGYSVINPLSTLVQEIIGSDETQTLEQAETVLSEALGITLGEGEDLSSYDPISDVSENAVANRVATLQIATVLAVAAAADDSDASDIEAVVLENLVEIVTSSTGKVSLDEETLSEILSDDSGVSLVSSEDLTVVTTAVDAMETIKQNADSADGPVDLESVLAEIIEVQAAAIDSISPAAPDLQLAADSNSGVSNADALTNDLNPVITVQFDTQLTDGSAVIAGDTIQLFDGNNLILSYVLQQNDIDAGLYSTQLADLTDGSEITARIEDIAGNTSDLSVSVSIDTDSLAFASSDTAAAIDENSAAQIIYTATVDGDDLWKFELSEDSDSALSIDAQTGVVTLSANPDFEAQSQYSFTVIATDNAGNKSEQPVTLDINNLDEIAPTITSDDTAVAVDENSGAEQVIYTATADDSLDISAGVTFSLTEDSDAALSIDASTGAVTLTTNPDHETQQQFSFAVVATDAAGNASEAQSVTLGINDLDDAAPTVTSGATAVAIDENSGAGQVIYTATSTDLGDDVSDTPIAYSLAEGSDAALSIDASTGAVTLDTDPDHETQSQFSFSVIATDAAGNASEAQSVTIDINNLDEVSPAFLTSVSDYEIGDGSASGQVILTAQADDTGDISNGVTFSLLEGDLLDPALSIDSSTGEVTLNESPDFDTKSSYSFTVLAEDGVNTGVVKHFTLDVVNIDEVAPTITSADTADAIDENSGAGQVVYTATADDSADVSNGVSYSLAEDSDAALTIDSVTGAVTLTTDSDHEAQSQYNFAVIATDAAGNVSDEQAVIIAVTNLDEVAPTITSVDSAAIDENSAAGQVIYTAIADDSQDISAGVSFSLTEGSDTGLTIDSSTGEVTLQTIPNYEAKSQYNFTVVASDGFNADVEQTVTLNVNNLDEIAPTIESGDTGNAVDENSGSGTVVYNASAADAADVSNGVSFSLADEELGFSIDAVTGEVTTNVDFSADFEDAQSQSFTVVATDAAGNASEQVVTVAVNNIDEIAPTVTSGGSAGTIDENSGAGSVIYTAVADDSLDISAGVSFSLAAGSDAALSIDASTGAVTLASDTDYEAQASYSFTVVASDGVNADVEQSVTLTVNNIDEVAPTITSGDSAASVDENSGTGSVIYVATADDALDISAGVSFSLSADSDAALSIDAESGAVTLSTNPNFEIQQEYNFTVIATDASGNSSEAQSVTIDINNLDEVAPTITSGASGIAVDENTGADQVVYSATATDDADISEGVTFSLADEELGFSIDADTGVVTTNADFTADFEGAESQSFTVVATDVAGNASEQVVTIAINNLDEVAPTITSSDSAVINENSGAGQVVYTATAQDNTDISTGVTFTLEDLNAETVLAESEVSIPVLEADTQHVYVSSSTKSEDGTQETVVISYNTDDTTTTGLGIRIHFDSTILSAPNIISALATDQIVAGQVENDDENLDGDVSTDQYMTFAWASLFGSWPGSAPVDLATITFDIPAESGTSGINITASSNAAGFAFDGQSHVVNYGVETVSDLSINATTGEVTLATDPDFEVTEAYNFKVIASDGVNPVDEQTVTLSVNDLDEVAPVINSVESGTSVNENSGAGQTVYTATASDDVDSAEEITFSLADETLGFSIDAATGIVTKNADFNADYEVAQSQSFTVIATDTSGNASQQIVTIAVNDLDEIAPTITSGGVATAVDENSATGQVVYTVSVDDSADTSDGVTYSLANETLGYSIDSGTGVVTTNNDFSADFENAQSQSFTVIATDVAGNSSEKIVTVDINNLDEVAPTINSGASASVLESAGADALVYRALVDDTADISEGVTFSLSNDSDAALTIDSGTGEVTLSDTPDSVTKSSYSFTVIADDGVNQSQKAVTLTVVDEDLEAPVFTSPVTVAVDENIGENQVIYTAIATDESVVEYSLLEGSDAGLAIDSDTGEVVLTDNPNFEIKPQYNFTVVASDGVNDAVQQSVTLDINNLDEVAPTIDSGDAGVAVDENSSSEQVVYTATATDTDANDEGITFTLADESLGFSIHADTGVVTTNADFAANFEDAESQSFTVVATDEAGNASEQVVTIAVNNLDEVAPTFDSGEIGVAVDENSGSGTVVYNASATDAADVSNGLSFSLADEELGFSVDADTGAVTTNADFAANFEEAESQSFTVVATDEAGNASEQLVTIAVNNLDEVAPTIDSGDVGVAVDENSGEGQMVYTATATDTDFNVEGITFTLADEALGYSIDAETGVVTTNADFSANYEDAQSQSFTVVATDVAGNASEQLVTIAVNNLDEVAPTIDSGDSAAIDENSAAGQVIYTAIADDSQDISAGISFSLTEGSDAGLTIDPSTGEVTLQTIPNYEAKSQYNFTVVASDGVNADVEQTVTLNVNNLDEIAPTIESGDTGNAVDENSGSGTVVYNASAADAADVSNGVSFSLADEELGFSVDADTGVVTTNDDFVADFELENGESQSFTVVATDAAGNASEQVVTIAINNLDEVAPTVTSGGSAGTIDENSGAGSVIYTAVADDSLDISAGVSFSLAAGSDAALSIDASTGAVTLASDTDYEAQASYSFTVVASDGVNADVEQSVTLTVNNLDEVAPTITSGDSAASVDENSGADQVIYTATASDTDFEGEEDITFSLSANSDTALSIDAESGAVTLSTNPNFEIQQEYDFTVIATDAAGNFSEQQVTLNIGNLDEVAPTITSSDTASVDEVYADLDDPASQTYNSFNGVVYTASATDTDYNNAEVIVFDLAEGADTALSIDASTGAVTLNTADAELSYQAQSEYIFDIIATDATGNSSDTQTVTLTVAEAKPKAAEIVLPEGTTNPDGTFTQNGNISVSNIKEGASWEYRLDNTLPWKSGVFPGENPSEGIIVIAEDGDYQIDVRVINAQGESTSLDSPVSISVDNMPPTAEFVTADSEAGTISINYNESLDPAYLPVTGDFDITQNGNELNVESVAVNDNVLVLSINESFSAGALNFTYEASIDVNEQLTDLAGNKVEQGFTQMIVSDGYIRGAQVYIDVNGDGIADESELREQVTSDSFGQIILTDEFLNAAENTDSNGNPYQVIVKGGVNMDSGAPNEIELTAPAGYSVINPLSTLVQEIASSLEVEVNTEGMSEEEIALATQAAKDAAKLAAESSLAETLGISLEEGSSLGSYDPQSDNNVANRVIATQIATVLAVASSTETTGSEGAETAALSSLANTISSAEGTVILDSSTMGEVLDGVVDDTAALDALNLAVDAMEAVKNSEDSDVAFAAIVQAQAKAIDTVAPQAPQPELSAAYDSGISDSDALTNVNNPVVRFVLDTLSTDGTAVVAGDQLEILNTGVSQGVFELTSQHIEDGYYDYTWVGELLDGDRFISATVTDRAGNISYVSTFVFEVDTAPLVITSDESANIDENSDADQIVYTATTSDLDFWKFELSSDSDPALTIDAQTGAVTLSADPDFEVQSQYSFTVIAFDNAGNTSNKAVTLDINNLDEVAPTITSANTAVAIDENSGASQVIYTATADDTADISDGFTFSLAEGSDAALSIDALSGEVTLATDPDHETQSQYSFAVIATDAAGNVSDAQSVTLDINDLDEIAPTITSGDTAVAIDENSGASQVIYTATADDTADISDGFTFSLAESSDAALSIDSVTGEVTLATDPDHETQSQYSFAVIATDAAGNASTEQAVTLDITDLDDAAPTVTSGDIAAAIDENSGAGQVVYTATSTDLDDDVADTPIAYSLAEGSDAALSIDSVTGEVTLATDPDHETQSQYSFTVIATDAAGNASAEQAVTLDITDLDDAAPTITSGATAVAIDENSGADQVIYTATADDTADISDGFTFSLAEGSDAALSIDSETGEVSLATDPDHETQSQYSFAVIATDAAGNASAEQAVTLDITDLDDAAPTVTSGDIAAAIDENSGAGQVVYTATSTDLDDDVADTPIAYSLAEGSDTALSIDSVTGEVTLATDPDHETQSQYSFAVIATDAAGNASEAQSVTLEINDLDDTAPIVTSGDTADAIDENSGAGQVIYTATADDSADISDGFTFSLAEGSDAALSIDSVTGEVTLATDPDHETQSQYSFTVIATDAAGNASAEQAVTLDITDLDDAAPTITSGATAVAIDENSGADQVIYTATADDTADISDGFTFSLAEGSDAALSIDSETGEVSLATDPDHETQSQYSFAVIATDAAGNASAEQAVTLDITDLDDAAPTVTSGDIAAAIDENSGAGQVVYTATSTDLDDDVADTPIAYSLAEGSDAALTIDSATGAVTLTTDPDHETQSQYSFAVIATDAAGNASEAQSVTLDINDLDDTAPIVTSVDTAVALDENSGAAEVIYTATADDSADVTDGVTFSLNDTTAYAEAALVPGVSTVTIPELAAATQHVYVSSSTKSEDGTQETVVVSYNADDTTTTGLGIRVHFDSSVLTESDITVIRNNDLLVNGVVENDSNDDDGDASTDKYISFGYASLFGSWPGSAPDELASITFDIAEGATGSSSINFSSSSNAAGFAFAGQNHEIAITGEAASVESQLSIDSATGDVTLSIDPDHETQSQYSFDVIATDVAGNASDAQSVTFDINDLDEIAPTITSGDTAVAIDENSGADQVIYTATADDTADISDGFTFSLAEGSDAALSIDSETGEVSLATDPDHETQSQYSFAVIATDAAGNASAEQAVTLDITDLDDAAPTVTSGDIAAAIDENSGAGQVVYTATSTDLDDDVADTPIAYSLAEGSDAALTIDSATGAVTLTTDPDHETQSQYSFAVIATDAAGNASEAQSVTLDINDLDDTAPIVTSVDTAVALDENSGAAEVIYTATADDSADVTDGVTFSLNDTTAYAEAALVPGVSTVTIPELAAATQHVYVSSSTKSEDGTQETVVVSYNADDTTTTGLGIRVHFDSSVLTESDITVIRNNDLLVNGVVENDSNDDDGDASTDKYISFGYASLFGSWPGSAPDELASITFDIAEGATGSSSINFSSSSNAAGFAFAGQNHEIAITGEAASVESQLSIDSATGDVTLSIDPDHETQSQYSFDVIATDVAGNASDAQSVTFDINDLDEIAPTITSGDTAVAIDENSGADQVIYTATADDTADISDGFTFSLAEGSDAALSIDSETGEVSLATDPDHETQSQYSFAVIATDAAGNASAEQAVTLDIADLDDTAPVITSALDNSLFDSPDTVIYTIEATDVDSEDGNITYSFEAQSVYQDPALPVGAFEQVYINNQDGSLSLQLFLDSSLAADYPDGLTFYDYVVNYNSLEVTVDQLLLPAAFANTVNTDIPEQISFATIHYPENFDIQGPIAQIDFDLQPGVYSAEFEVTNIQLPNNATPDDSIDTIVGADSSARYLGNDGLSFNEATGEVSLPNAPDALSQPVYSFTVTATDAAGNSSSELITVIIDGAPVVTSTDNPDGIEENTGSGQIIYTATSSKPSVFSLAEGSDAGLTIDPATGAVTLADDPDYETQTQYSFAVIATDVDDGTSISAPKDITVEVINLDESAATFNESTVTMAIDENIGEEEVIFTANADDSADASNGIAYSLSDARLDDVSTDNLSIDPQTGEVTLANNPDYETGEQYTFIVGATDGVNTPVALQTVTLDVNNLDDAAPIIISGATVADIDENSGAAQVIYTATADDSADISDGVTFSLSEDSDDALSIDENTGEVTLTADPDYEAQSQYSFAVIATDAAGNASEAQSLTLDINDLNDTDEVAPTITSGASGDPVDENTGAGQVVYSATADDSADYSEGFSFSLADDGLGFSIDAETGVVATNDDFAADFEAAQSQSFTLVVTDVAGNASEQVVNVAVNNLDEVAPTITSAAETVVVDLGDTDPVIYTATSDDSADVTDGVTFSLNDTTAYAGSGFALGVSTVTIPELAAATQHVYVSSSTKSEDGSQETVVVSYNADDTTTTGLGIRVHFDSSVLTESDITVIRNNDLLVNGVVENDSNDDDGDASTDKYISFGYASLFGSWPGSAPDELASITFDIAEGATGSSSINFSSSSNAAGFAFDGQNHEVAITGEAVIVESQLSIDSTTGLVTLSGELDPATQSEYSFTVTATDTAGNSSDLDVVVDAEQPMVDAAMVVVVEGDTASAPIYQASANVEGVSYQITDLTQYPDAGSGSSSAESQISIPELAAATQHVYVSSSTKSEDGTQETVVVSYNADDTTTTGLGLRIHFDSSVLSASDITTLMTNDLLVNAVVESDDSDLDGDASTDTYVQFGWASLFGAWPGSAPVDLASITFDIAEGATGSSAINFSTSSNAAGFAFDGQDHNLVLAAEAVVPAAELVIDNAAGTVSLDAAANSDVMPAYSFTVEGTDADGDAIGSQTVPVVVVDQIVNADASSYTGTADEDVFALADGSAEITSGAGEDDFVLDPAFASASHTITDFESGVDTIDISAALVAAGYTADNAPTQLGSADMSADILDLVNGDDSSLDNLFGATYDEESNTLTVFADSDSSAGSADMDSFQITLDDSATVEDDDIVADLSAFIA